MTELTARLLRERTTRLFAEMPVESWVKATEKITILCCERCGQTVDLITEPMPPGWTTIGSHERGWTDLCRGCSG